MARRLSNVGTETVLATVAEYYKLSPGTFQERRRGDESRDVAAWLGRRLTTATLRELAELFALHPGNAQQTILLGGRGMVDDGGEWQQHLVAKIFFREQMEKMTDENSRKTR